MVIDDSPSWTEQLGNGLLSLTMDSHRIGARNSPKQAKNEIIQQKIYSVSLRLHLSWDLSVLSWDREIELKTVSLTTKSWDLRGLLVCMYGNSGVLMLYVSSHREINASMTSKYLISQKSYIPCRNNRVLWSLETLIEIMADDMWSVHVLKVNESNWSFHFKSVTPPPFPYRGALNFTPSQKSTFYPPPSRMEDANTLPPSEIFIEDQRHQRNCVRNSLLKIPLLCHLHTCTCRISLTLSRGYPQRDGMA